MKDTVIILMTDIWIKKRSQVFREIRELKNGGIGGYIYIDHLREYDKHPKKTMMGHLPIGNMMLAVSLFWTAEIKLKWTDKSVSPSVSP